MPNTDTVYRKFHQSLVKNNITTVNQAWRFIVNMFDYGRIISTGFKHADIKGVM